MHLHEKSVIQEPFSFGVWKPDSDIIEYMLMMKDDPSFAAGDEGPGVQGMELHTHHSLGGTLHTMDEWTDGHQS